MDQLVSGQPGLIPQIGGHLTCARIWAANILLIITVTWYMLT